LLIVNAICFTVSWLIYIRSFPVFIACRFLQGLTIGALVSIAPLMIKELSPIEISGALGSLSALNVALGMFFACFISYSLMKLTGDESGHSYWFILFGVPQAVLFVQSLLLVFAFPF
jgi:MFS family permease